ncbi:phosphoribosylformylglycinamidine cyclo-ligase [Candidatus Micrarchaeota archaeon]|nr:phosphoribosylformylglycinamidine cyclo-ligase [Candidatus Micrarchaeota archaeon]
MSISYKDAGVDISKVKLIQNKINETIFAGKSGALVGHYAGIVKLGSSSIAIHTDGVGSKVLVAQDLEKYDTVGIDAIAMNVNDIICIGAKPLAGVDYLALAEEDDFLVSEIMKGLVKGAEESNIEIVGGETAILPEIIKGGKRPFDLAFTAIGEVKEVISGEAIKPGDIIIGLESSGLHSNGYTLARKILDVNEWGQEMLIPTRIYVKPVMEMISSCKISGIAHITGGAFSKLTRLNKKHGFLLDSMPKLKPIFIALAEKVQDEKEMHRTFNMGIGLCIIVPKEKQNTVLSIAEKHNINSQVIGKIISDPGVFLEKEGKKIKLD